MRPKQKESRVGRREGAAAGESLLNRKIVSPERLKILVLAGNELMSEQLEFLQKCSNLIKLDLSHNHITRLPDKADFSHLLKLEVLLLHHNKFSLVDSLAPLSACPQLTYLTLHHNPLEATPRHEHQLVNSLPALKLLNHRIIHLQERSPVLPDRPATFIDPQLFENWKSAENSQAYYLRVLNLQLQYIDNVWAFSNPIVIIQRFWRHFQPTPSSITPPITRHQSRRSPTRKTPRAPATAHPLRGWFEEWKKFSMDLREVRQTMKKIPQKGRSVDKTYLLLRLQEYFLWLRNQRIRQPLLDFLKKVRRVIYERKMVHIVMQNLNLKRNLFQGGESFYEASGIAETNKIYYNRSQQHIIDNFLTIIAEKYNKRQAIFNKSKLQVTNLFKAIRLVDPETYTNRYSSAKRCFSFCCLLWPSMKPVIVMKKKVAGKFKSGFIGIRQMSYIKNRDKVVTLTQMKKSQQTYRRLQKFSQQEYQSSLWEFECKDHMVMKQLLRMIYYHNVHAVKFQVKKKRSEMLSLLENYDQPLILYVEKVLRRTCAAVTIQKTWRRYTSNKAQKQTIYFQMKQNRAALHIQHFWRNSTYRHRSHFNKLLYRDLALLTTPTILYPLQIYMSCLRIYNSQQRGSLFTDTKLTRQNGQLGLKEQFYRPLFHPIIRYQYFEGRALGMESHEEEIDIFNLFHFGSQSKVIERAKRQFICLTYKSKSEAAIVASIIALFTYQLWGKYYIFPLTLTSLNLWQSRIETYLHVRIIKDIIKPFKSGEESSYTALQIKQNGVFLYRNQDKFPASVPTLTLQVEFYQKRYHNFPLKHVQMMRYAFINVKEKEENTPIKMEIEQDKTKSLMASQPSFRQRNLLLSSDQLGQLGDTYLNITTIDKKRFSLFDQSQKNIGIESAKSALGQMSKTVAVVREEGKKEKVMKFYKEEFIRREAQKDLKQTGLAAIREKAKQEKTMNATLRSMKEAERTEVLRSKVDKVKEWKRRASKDKPEDEFMQQNNFVMEQQLRMVIMRSRMKQADARKDSRDLRVSRPISNEKQSDRHTIQSRKSSKQKMRLEEEDNNSLSLLAQTNLGGQADEGSVINVRKKMRKSRANSIGAYIRDPSYVHGVFPEEYYPIQNRATSFYFPPVV